MFSFVVLSPTEKVSGDGRKKSHERRITETDRGRRREREQHKLVLGDQCMFYCLFGSFVHKDEGRGEEASDACEQFSAP